MKKMIKKINYIIFILMLLSVFAGISGCLSQPISYNNDGLNHYNNLEYDQAFLDFNKAIDLNPKQAAAYNNRGQT